MIGFFNRSITTVQNNLVQNKAVCAPITFEEIVMVTIIRMMLIIVRLIFSEHDEIAHI